ncbi:hypothetical protein A4G20_08160 [Pasteurellaceae bacterium RH1A]|nr:hypothetical protein A4G20_08160 [Pasteurellaceae bacterium RH1A]
MFKDKPVISNQHGALVMALIPFLYAIFTSHFHYQHLFLGLSWLFLYFCSYPFLALFSKKPTARNKKWASIYAALALVFALPVVFYQPAILQFTLPILPLAGLQIYYAKRKDERNLINDLAGILTFGLVGMAAAYLVTETYNWAILLHPALFFMATTLYIKSVARERRNPLYLKLSLGSHLILGLIYALLGQYGLALAYGLGLLRAAIIPRKNLNVKQVGMLEFPVVLIFFIALIFS